MHAGGHEVVHEVVRGGYAAEHAAHPSRFLCCRHLLEPCAAGRLSMQHLQHLALHSPACEPKSGPWHRARCVTRWASRYQRAVHLAAQFALRPPSVTGRAWAACSIHRSAELALKERRENDAGVHDGASHIHWSHAHFCCVTVKEARSRYEEPSQSLAATSLRLSAKLAAQAASGAHV